MAKSAKVAKEVKVEECKTGECECKPTQSGNVPTPEHVQATATAFYNAALKIVDAGSLVMPFNQPLGMTIIKLAEALTDQVGVMTGFKPQNGQNGQSCGTQNQKRKIELDENTLKEIESLEQELADELGDL